MLDVTPIPAFADNYLWLIRRPESRQAVIVDPGDASPVLAYLNQQDLELAAILITHHHADHVGGIASLLEHFEVPVYGPAMENIPGITEKLNDGDRIHIPALDTDFEILHVPGHTRGHIAYYGDDKLFCGDTLFAGGCGRLFEGTPAEMQDSLSRIAELPEETLFYCAHEYTLANLGFAEAVEPENEDLLSRIAAAKLKRAANQPTVPDTLETELATNPFLRADQPSVKSAAERHTGKTLNSTVDVFAAVRKWKDNF